MPYRGVIFDLYGTLIDGWGSAEAERRGRELGTALGVPLEPFRAQLNATYSERATGVLGDTAQMLRQLCRRIGEHPDDRVIERAAALRREQFRAVLTAPRAETASLLATIRARGFRVGLISDCSAETPELWPELSWALPIEAPVFSCSEGRRKPDSDLYRLALTRLDLDPSECIYIGDGGSQELSGAEALGIAAFKIVYRRDSADEHLQYDPDLDWRGTELSLLSEVLPLMGSYQTVRTQTASGAAARERS